ncbi:hypothetical protein [Zavarzinella formosa]|uniref:hypothetical protein n=1 Tax=Zavarzinella formosa TaxID=360055 RepID=UPI000374E85F|nr:hypothetical protein [Zavarzinella formosa]
MIARSFPHRLAQKTHAVQTILHKMELILISWPASLVDASPIAGISLGKLIFIPMFSNGHRQSFSPNPSLARESSMPNCIGHFLDQITEQVWRRSLTKA